MTDLAARAEAGKDHPLGFDAAASEWNAHFAGREQTLEDWNRLTLGEQQRYAAQECKTKGAIYSSKITRNSIAFTVSLPDALAMDGLTRDDADRLERHMHRVLEHQIASILQLRRMGQQK